MTEGPARGGERWAAAAGLTIALVLPLLPLGRWLAPGDAIPALLLREAVWWSYAGIVVAWLLMVEGKPLSSIGLRRPTWRTFAYALAAAMVVTGILIAHFALIVPALHLNGAKAIDVRAQIMRTPYWYRILLVLRAAVVEELLFRAYMMEKVRQLTGIWLAGRYSETPPSPQEASEDLDGRNKYRDLLKQVGCMELPYIYI
jgi:membrane protease YdiL (CAAX protease family)